MRRRFVVTVAIVFGLARAGSALQPCQDCWTDRCPSLQDSAPKCPAPAAGDRKPKKPHVIRVQTRPPEAVVDIDGATVGNAPVTMALAPGKHVVEAQVPGYAPAKLRITMPRDKDLPLTLTLRGQAGGKTDAKRKPASSGLLDAFAHDQAEVSDALGPGGIGQGINAALADGDTGSGDTRPAPRGGLGLRGAGGQSNARAAQYDLGGRAVHPTGDRLAVSGGLRSDEIQQVVRERYGEIRACYEKELSKDPTLAGKLSLHWVISPTGEVSESAVKETDLHNAAAEDCMVSVTRHWRFPAPVGGGSVNVSYPFVFVSQ